MANATLTASDPIAVDGLATSVTPPGVAEAVGPAATTMLAGGARRFVVPFSKSRNS